MGAGSLWGDPRWDTPRGICLLQQEERYPLGAVGHVAMAQHSIPSALGHVSTEFSGLDGPQRSKKAVFTGSETLKFPLSLRQLDSWLSNSPGLPERLLQSGGSRGRL